MTQILRLGTRRSQLALTQSQWVASQIQQKFPQIQIQLVGIETTGDRILDRPLQEVPGKDFFVAEIDQALLRGEVDFTVHSLKDLSLERPPEIVTAAIPKRENPRDLIIFHRRVLSKSDGIRIGTSSPRRLENIPTFLGRSLPGNLANKKLEWIETRGNVPTRLGHLHLTGEEPKRLDAVVLALAGLNRLMADSQSRLIVEPLLKDTLFQVIPLQEGPTAPGQGALSVECLSKNELLLKILQSIHDPASEETVRLERKVLGKHGGGCHQRFGASYSITKRLGLIGFVRGKSQNGEHLNNIDWKPPGRPKELDPKRFWDGSDAPFQSKKNSKAPELSAELIKNGLIFISHKNALPDAWTSTLIASSTNQNFPVWCSGMKTWEALAKLGIWVQGCAETGGISAARETMISPSLRLPPESHWRALTHDRASDFDFGIQKIETHALQRPLQLTEDSLARFKNAQFFFWTSPAQFEDLFSKIHQPHVHHSCGPGRTAETLLKRGLGPIQSFPNREEWLKWLR